MASAPSILLQDVKDELSFYIFEFQEVELTTLKCQSMFLTF